VKFTNTELWDVRDIERREEMQLRNDIATIDRELFLARKSISLQSAAGFKEFLDGIQKLREVTVRKMVGCTEGNDQLRILQGKAQALQDILSLLEKSEMAAERLAALQATLQNDLALALERRPIARSKER